MLRLRHSACTRTFIVPLTLVCFLAACYKYTSVEPPYSAAMEENQPKQLRITVGEDSTFTVKKPRIEGETLAGESKPCPGSRTERSCDASFALADITRLEVRGMNKGATIGLIAGVSVAIAAVVIAGVAASGIAENVN